LLLRLFTAATLLLRSPPSCSHRPHCCFFPSLPSLFLFRLTLDFDTNKKIAEEVAIIPSKRLRNQIAGFVTHLMKRIQRGGSVRGISLKLQEEERERRLDFIPQVSILDVDTVDIDSDTADLLKSIDFADLAGVAVQSHQSAAGYVKRQDRGDRKPRQGGDKKGAGKPKPQKTEAAAAPAATQ